MKTALLGLALAAATAESQMAQAPVPIGDPESWILIGDFPASAPAGEEAFVSYRLTIGADERVKACDGSDGMRPPAEQASSPYVQRTCDLLRDRARFIPATDAEGRAVAGVYSGIGRWSRFDMGGGRMITHPLPVWPQEPSAPSTLPPLIIEQRPARLLFDPAEFVDRTYPPAARREQLEGTVGYVARVGADGRVTACTIVASSNHADLDEATCRLLLRYARFSPAIGDRGEPVAQDWEGQLSWRLPQDAPGGG